MWKYDYDLNNTITKVHENDKREIFQVLNESGYPASDDLDDLCMFSTQDDAEEFIRDLHESGALTGADIDKLTIKRIKIT